MAKRKTVLQVSNLTKSYGDHVIVDDFNLTVAEGEAVALTGRNGAGKSTVLRCVIGADRPTSGEVEVCGMPMNEADPEVRRNVATVIDDLDFFPDLSVVEHSGQRRRLALATAFVRPRKLLVLDEPEQRLDVEGIAWLGRRLRQEMEQGLAIVMASHEPSLVQALGADGAADVTCA